MKYPARLTLVSGAEGTVQHKPADGVWVELAALTTAGGEMELMTPARYLRVVNGGGDTCVVVMTEGATP